MNDKFIDDSSLFISLLYRPAGGICKPSHSTTCTICINEYELRCIFSLQFPRFNSEVHGINVVECHSEALNTVYIPLMLVTWTCWCSPIVIFPLIKVNCKTTITFMCILEAGLLHDGRKNNIPRNEAYHRHRFCAVNTTLVS